MVTKSLPSAANDFTRNQRAFKMLKDLHLWTKRFSECIGSDKWKLEWQKAQKLKRLEVTIKVYSFSISIAMNTQAEGMILILLTVANGLF